MKNSFKAFNLVDKIMEKYCVGALSLVAPVFELIFITKKYIFYLSIGGWQWNTSNDTIKSNNENHMISEKESETNG